MEFYAGWCEVCKEEVPLTYEVRGTMQVQRNTIIWSSFASMLAASGFT